MSKSFWWLLALCCCGLLSCHSAPLPASGPSLASPSPATATEREAALLDQVARATLDPAVGGATIDLVALRRIEIGEKAVAVSKAGGTELPGPPSLDVLRLELRRFIERHPELKGGDGAKNYLGTWLDAKNRRVAIDVTLLIPYRDDEERTRALKIANEIGLSEGQRSLFDLGSGTSIPVAGSSSDALL